MKILWMRSTSSKIKTIVMKRKIINRLMTNKMI